jgi:hypothetical protein
MKPVHVLAWPGLFGLCESGQGDWMPEHGELAIDGRLPINPGGGFRSFGEAATAQGLGTKHIPRLRQRLIASTSTPAATMPMPSQSRSDGRSPRKANANTATSTRLNLSTGATRDASPICSARK